MKVFQIGFNKCATLSLYYFFVDNGLKSAHYDHGGIAREIIARVDSGDDCLLGSYEDYGFLCGMEFVCDWRKSFWGANYGFKKFRELDEKYPGSKFILNTRSIDGWLKSRIRHGGHVLAAPYEYLWYVRE